MVTETKPTKRDPLSRERVFEAAVQLADESGLEAVTMRRLAEKLGVEAMSLYYHVANKEAILDGVVDALIDEIEVETGDFDAPTGEAPWKEVMRARILTARRIMLRHKWAPSALETRTSISAPMMRYFNSLLGIMVGGGFSYDLGHHALHALGSIALGFSQELFSPAPGETEKVGAEIGDMLGVMAERLPYLTTMLDEISHDDGPDATLGWCDDQTEFEFALDLMLDGLERHLERD